MFNSVGVQLTQSVYPGVVGAVFCLRRSRGLAAEGAIGVIIVVSLAIHLESCRRPTTWSSCREVSGSLYYGFVDQLERCRGESLVRARRGIHPAALRAPFRPDSRQAM